MFRIDNSSAVTTKPAPPPAGTPGYFTNGNPATAQEATVVDDWWCNTIQEEILTVIEQAGIAPDKSKTSQLFEALNVLFQGIGDLGDTYLTVATYKQWEAPVLTTGGPAAYSMSYSIPPTALVDGMTHIIEFHVANAAAAGLNVNALGLKPIHYYSVGAWRPVPPNLWGANQQQKVSYHAATDAYRLTGWRDTTGDLVPTGRGAERAGTILGLGQAVSRVDYAGLFAAYGTTFGQGNGSTTFNLPDLRGRIIAGTDQGAGRIGTSVAGTLGSFGGQEMVQYNVTGTAASQSVNLTGTITGTAHTQNVGVTVSGNTNTPGGTGMYGGIVGGGDVSHDYHYHWVSLNGTVTGNATVDGSCTLAGWTGGGSINGTTDTRTNMPPSFVANHAICL